MWISVRFDTFSVQFCVHLPFWNSEACLSGVSCDQEKLWQGKYLNQIEELLGKRIGVYLDIVWKVIFFTDVSWCSTRIIWFFSSRLTRSFFWIEFKIWKLRDHSILPPAFPDCRRLSGLLSVVLFCGRISLSCGIDVYVFDIFWSCGLEIKLFRALDWLMTASRIFSSKIGCSIDAVTWANFQWFCFCTATHTFTFILWLLFPERVLVGSET